MLDALRTQGVIDARGVVVLNGAFADRLYPGVMKPADKTTDVASVS